jgi:hypothetical protein
MYQICTVTLPSNADQNPAKIMQVTAQRVSSTANSKNSPFPITLPSYFPTLSPICLDQKVERTPLVKLLSRTILLFFFDICNVSNCVDTSFCLLSFFLSFLPSFFLSLFFSFLFFLSFFLSFSFTAAHISSIQRERTYILRVSMIYLPSVLVLLIDQIEKEFFVVRHIFPVHT